MTPAQPRHKWELTETGLARFLAALDAHAERAAERYESLRLALVKFFDWQRAMFPEDLADETINRVARKLDEGEELRDAASFCHGVARLVLLESRKGPAARRVEMEALETVAAPIAPDREEEDDRSAALQHCLNELPPESRALILRYYEDERREKIDGRTTLAAELRIPLNALRSRAQRIRDRLERCVKKNRGGAKIA